MAHVVPRPQNACWILEVGAKLVSTWSVFNRPEAASHLKRFVMRKLEESSRDGRWSYDVSAPVSRDIAEVMVGNLLGGVDELAWQFFPDLRQDLVDDTSTRARVAGAIERILHGTSSDIENTAEAIVRGVLSELGYKSTKGLFDFERKAERVADRSQAGTQAAAEAPDGVPLPQRNK